MNLMIFALIWMYAAGVYGTVVVSKTQGAPMLTRCLIATSWFITVPVIYTLQFIMYQYQKEVTRIFLKRRKEKMDEMKKSS